MLADFGLKLIYPLLILIMAEQQFLEKIQASSIHSHIIGVEGYAGEMTILVKPTSIPEVIRFLKEQEGFSYLVDITGSDHYTDEGRFEVAYNLANVGTKQRLRVATRVGEENPSVPTITNLFTSAAWREREAYDMVGVAFEGHEDLRRIFMPEDYDWYPLRKEFPLLGIPGSIALPEKDPPKPYK